MWSVLCGARPDVVELERALLNRSQAFRDPLDRGVPKCLTCREYFRYDTDHDGHTLESCACGRHYVPNTGHYEPEFVERYSHKRKLSSVSRTVTLKRRAAAS